MRNLVRPVAASFPVVLALTLCFFVGRCRCDDKPSRRLAVWASRETCADLPYPVPLGGAFETTEMATATRWEDDGTMVEMSAPGSRNPLDRGPSSLCYTLHVVDPERGGR